MVIIWIQNAVPLEKNVCNWTKDGFLYLKINLDVSNFIIFFL